MDLVVIEHVTLDSVMQAPGRPDEDTRDGFTAGGWAAPYPDAIAMAQAAKSMATSTWCGRSKPWSGPPEQPERGA